MLMRIFNEIYNVLIISAGFRQVPAEPLSLASHFGRRVNEIIHYFIL